MKIKKFLIGITILATISMAAGCGSSKQESKKIDLNSTKLEEIVEKAKQEKEVDSVGMPDTWANWVGTWKDIKDKYGISHKDTDMSSAEELALFESEKSNPTKDIGDVGQAFGPVAVEKGLALPYKTSYYKDVPDWAKDKDGNWIVSYTGTIAIITNTDKVKNPPKSFKDLLNGKYKVTIGDVNAATQAQNAVLSAAVANGGNEENIEPGLDFFAKLAEQGRLDLGDTSVQRLENGEIEVGLFWDFNALNYRDSIVKNNPNAHFDIIIPEDASVQSGYTTIINKYAPHPYAAALTREFILSDQGQINLAKGYARPIRSNVKLPKDVASKLLPDSMYKNVYQVKNKKAWDKTAKNLGTMWQDKVLSKIKK